MPESSANWIIRFFKSIWIIRWLTNPVADESGSHTPLIRCKSVLVPAPHDFTFLRMLIFYCCKQSLTRLYHPSIHPPTHPSIHPGPYFFAQKGSDCNFTVWISSHFVQIIIRQVRTIVLFVCFLNYMNATFHFQILSSNFIMLIWLFPHFLK